jgi:AcrR family transcriptional regulator
VELKNYMAFVDNIFFCFKFVSDYSLFMIKRKEIILDNATKLFATEGFDHVSTKRIAEEAGVSEGLVFRHYVSKEGLLKAILEKGLAQIADTLKPMTELGEKDNAIDLHLKLTAEALKTHTIFWQLVHSLRFNPRVGQLLGKEMEQGRAMITDLLRNYFKRIGRANPKNEAQLYFAIVDGIALQYLENPDTYPLADVIKQLKKHYNE